MAALEDWRVAAVLLRGRDEHAGRAEPRPAQRGKGASAVACSLADGHWSREMLETRARRASDPAPSRRVAGGKRVPGTPTSLSQLLRGERREVAWREKSRDRPDATELGDFRIVVVEEGSLPQVELLLVVERPKNFPRRRVASSATPGAEISDALGRSTVSATRSSWAATRCRALPPTRCWIASTRSPCRCTAYAGTASERSPRPWTEPRRRRTRMSLQSRPPSQPHSSARIEREHWASSR